jgi:NAD(P)-dependent dehydrogenase (short-subunit alcohol dehydrogenase family)
LKRFQERVAVVTGGGQGIGRQVGRAFAAEGARVVTGEVPEAHAEAAVRLLY